METRLQQLEGIREADGGLTAGWQAREAVGVKTEECAIVQRACTDHFRTRGGSAREVMRRKALAHEL